MGKESARLGAHVQGGEAMTSQETEYLEELKKSNNMLRRQLEGYTLSVEFAKRKPQITKRPERCSFCGIPEGTGWLTLYTSAYASICVVCAHNVVNSFNLKQAEKRLRSFLEQARVLGGQPAPPAPPSREIAMGATLPPHFPPGFTHPPFEKFRLHQADQAFRNPERWEKTRIPHTCGDNPDLPCKGCAQW